MSEKAHSPHSADKKEKKEKKKARPVHGVSQEIKPETVTKYVYDVHNDKWSNFQTQVILESTPFDEGSMRAAFFMLDPNNAENPKWVAKMSKDPKESKSTYFLDVEMQALASLFADEYNKRGVPKPVKFIETAVIKCMERKGLPLLSIEPFIDGDFEKHSNNYGYVHYDDRNTPQSFSHFTYCCSGGKLLICDIQGVGYMLTDPQIHSRDGKGFGKGNLGHQGMVKFFQTHRCNTICKHLGLPLVNPKTQDRGTTVGIDNLSNRLSKSSLDLKEQKEEVQVHRTDSPRDHISDVVPDDVLDPKFLQAKPKKVQQVQSAFLKYCNPATKRVGFDEFIGLCGNLGVQFQSRQQADKVFKKLDALSEGSVDMRQFVWFFFGVEE